MGPAPCWAPRLAPRGPDPAPAQTSSPGAPHPPSPGWSCMPSPPGLTQPCPVTGMWGGGTQSNASLGPTDYLRGRWDPDANVTFTENSQDVIKTPTSRCCSQSPPTGWKGQQSPRLSQCTLNHKTRSQFRNQNSHKYIHQHFNTRCEMTPSRLLTGA